MLKQHTMCSIPKEIDYKNSLFQKYKNCFRLLLDKLSKAVQKHSTGVTTEDQNDTEFEIPADLESTVRLLRSVRTEMQTIEDQLAEAKTNNSQDFEWLKRARFALRKKNEHRAALADYIAAQKQKAKDVRDALGQISIINHLKFHSKLVGRLNELLFLVEDHLEKDDDETFYALEDAVGVIRGMSAAKS
jgi:septal ring factor EnvC (AmiA/AmiB activator)